MSCPGDLFAEGVAERSGYWQDVSRLITVAVQPDWLTAETPGGGSENDGVCGSTMTVRSVTKFRYHACGRRDLDGRAPTESA